MSQTQWSGPQHIVRGFPQSATRLGLAFPWKNCRPQLSPSLAHPKEPARRDPVYVGPLPPVGEEATVGVARAVTARSGAGRPLGLQ